MTARHARSALVAVLAVSIWAAAGAAQLVDRSKPPQPGELPRLQLPPTHPFTLPNGLRVWVVEQHEVPVVHAVLLLKVGATADPQGQFGLASLTAALLDEGAGTRSALELADAIDFLGAELSTGSSYDATSAALHVPATRFDEALPLLADVVIRPTFADEEFERVRELRLTALQQSRDDPAAIAAAAFPRVLYGAAHRYGTGLHGTLASVREISAQSVREFHRRYYHPALSTLIIAGDITPEQARKSATAAFGEWRGTGRPPDIPPVPEIQQQRRRRVFIVDKPDAPQSQIRAGWIGVQRNTSEYFPLTVLNTILGGSFTSRLNMNLRETHGYAYSAGSVFDMRVGPGPFVAAAGVQADKTAEAVREFFNEFERLREPVPEDELRKARNLVALAYPAGFESTRDLGDKMAEKVIFGLPENYFETYTLRVDGVTEADLLRVAQRFIVPERFTVVIVGDRRTIEPPVRALGLGPLTPLTVDEVMGGR